MISKIWKTIIVDKNIKLDLLCKILSKNWPIQNANVFPQTNKNHLIQRRCSLSGLAEHGEITAAIPIQKQA